MPTLDDTLSHDVLELLRDMLHGLLTLSVPAWIDLQLTMPQLRTVFIVAHAGSASVTEVSQHLGVGEPTASHLLDKLVRNGLIERAEDPSDRRRTLVKLTPAGEDFIEKLMGWKDLLGRLLQNLSDEELTHLQLGLQAVVDEMAVKESHIQLLSIDGDRKAA